MFWNAYYIFPFVLYDLLFIVLFGFTIGVIECAIFEINWFHDILNVTQLFTLHDEYHHSHKPNLLMSR
jgi:hypothetical protein